MFMNGDKLDREPSPTQLVVTKEIDGYQVSAEFYPGFARAIDVNGVSLYEQKADGPFPFNLADGEGPLTSSAMTLSSSKGYRVVLNLDDSGQAIDQIQLVLRPSKPTTGGGVTAFQDDGDRWSIFNTVVYCPPFC
jgi:hypothetical protein